ncbi:hypothetical protein ABZS76_02870 [Streptomyces sp. NPDC005562]|uniref:hypothetical protein n=1 Tax=Streptomyces sp. NPDC005562 TaxID=3154890 RepID=UPI0033B7BC0B
MRANRGWIRAGAVCLAVGVLASCGTDDWASYSGGTLEELTPQSERRGRELAVEGMRLLKDAESVRIGVDMTTAKGTKKVSLKVDRDGNCTGTFADGAFMRGELLVVADDATYARYSDETLDAIVEAAARRGPEAVAGTRERADLARGKYLKLPKGSSMGSVPATGPATCDLDAFTAAMPAAPKPGETFEALDRTHRYGRDVIPVTGRQNGQRTTMYVAAEGKPYVVAVSQVENGEAMIMRLSDYDEPVHAKAPPPDRTLDISRFAPGGPGPGSLFEV